MVKTTNKTRRKVAAIGGEQRQLFRNCCLYRKEDLHEKKQKAMARWADDGALASFGGNRL